MTVLVSQDLIELTGAGQANAIAYQELIELVGAHLTPNNPVVTTTQMLVEVVLSTQPPYFGFASMGM